MTGTTALSPIATNMPARTGRHLGERKLGRMEKTVQVIPIVTICKTIVSNDWETGSEAFPDPYHCPVHPLQERLAV